eukprot:TRINITY_DN1667_c0_g1_i1.p1 TRINITY_DN1667_c0_g1~~TRINITY_DN1667_c0_g1_i1.p1  ORF type:complete len:335 (+),score=32.52 TRINITY_DN1667_c0_g1_i1:84-1088(+)
MSFVCLLVLLLACRVQSVNADNCQDSSITVNDVNSMLQTKLERTDIPLHKALEEIRELNAEILRLKKDNYLLKLDNLRLQKMLSVTVAGRKSPHDQQPLLGITSGSEDNDISQCAWGLGARPYEVIRFSVRGESGGEQIEITIGADTSSHTLSASFQILEFLWPDSGFFNLSSASDGVFIQAVQPGIMEIDATNRAWNCGNNESIEDRRCREARAGNLSSGGNYVVYPGIQLNRNLLSYYGDENAFDLQEDFVRDVDEGTPWIQFPSLSACAAAVAQNTACGTNFSYAFVGLQEPYAFHCECCRKGKTCGEQRVSAFAFGGTYFYDFLDIRPEG